MRKRKAELKKMEEELRLKAMKKELIEDGLKEGNLVSNRQIGFTKEGNLIVNLYNSDVCYDLTANKEVTKEVVDEKYVVSEQTLKRFNDKDKLEAYEAKVINRPTYFVIKLADLIEIAQNEKSWKQQEREEVKTHEQQIMNRMKEMIEATYGKLY